ncbi:MAG: hypothetical protein ABIL05_01000, partial [candidate division WOR-3 bacterium]
PEYLYWYRGTNLFRFHKRTGKVEPGAGIPPEAKWFKMTTNEMLRKFPFLSPYYYNDEDFNRYSISAIFEDGLDLYVGTIGYGLFKYHRLTWEKSHITFGPYTGNIRVIYKDDSRFYFLGDRSISIYHWEGDSFSNFICKNNIEAFIPYQNRIYISSANRLLSFEGKFAYPISDLRNNVTTLTLDSNEIIFATTSGVYRLNPLSNSVLSLGLENIHINKIISDDSYIYAATKNGLYRYKRDSKIWERLINIPFLDIIRFDINRYYLISFNRQLYETNGDSLSALPYMNLTCFATDGELLYLGTLLGLDIYNPATRIYRSASFLPEEKINSMAIFLDTLWLATDKSLLKIATDKFK